MIRSIEIENLRGIQSGKIEGLARLTMLVGPNGCGKSTVLDALNLGGASDPVAALIRAVERREESVNGGRWLVNRRGASMARIVTTGEAGPVGRSITSAQDPSLRLVVTEHTTELGSVGFGGARAQGRIALRAPTGVEARLVEPGGSNGPLYQVYSKALEEGRKDLALAIVRAALGDDLQDITLGVEGDTPVVMLVRPTGSVPVWLSGDGVRALVRIALELAACAGGLALVEEPEVHQHPASLAQTARILLETARRDVQVVITTHSIELVDSILSLADASTLAKIAVFRLRLVNGTLFASCIPGPDAAERRAEFQDDLR